MILIQCLGELELWVDGRAVISVGGLVHRMNAASRVQGTHFETFFGGKYSAGFIIDTMFLSIL